MSLSIHNFFTLLDAQQLKKGKQYFEDGAVTYATEVKPDKWKAEVAGTDTYYVTITLYKDAIATTDCDCPHDDSFCKHVVAVLFSIQQQKGLTSSEIAEEETASKKKKDTNKTIPFEKVLEQTGEKELKSFVKNFAARNKEFRNLFLLHFQLTGTENNLEKFRTLIRQTAALYTRQGIIEWDNTKKALQPAVDILEEAGNHFGKEDFRITFDACCAIILEVPPLFDYMDDSKGVAGDCMYGAFNFLAQLTESTVVPYALKDETFSFAQDEFGKSIYINSGFDRLLLQLLVAAAHEADKQQKVFTIIDKELAKGGNDYHRKWLLDTKIALLQKTGREREAAALVQSNVSIPEYRQQLIQQYIEDKDWYRAKMLAEEGIQTETSKQGWHRNTERWEEWLLKIAVLQNDVPAIRKLCKSLYFGRNFHHAYYELYRKTFMEEEWKTERENWIQWFANKDRITPQQTFALAQIYAAEHFYDRLLHLLQKAPDYGFAEFCKPYLEEQYGQELLEIYRQSLIQFAASSSNRNEYIELRKRLKNVQSIAGGKEVVKELVKSFLTQYKQRRAMKEELEKLMV